MIIMVKNIYIIFYFYVSTKVDETNGSPTSPKPSAVKILPIIKKIIYILDIRY